METICTKTRPLELEGSLWLDGCAMFPPEGSKPGMTTLLVVKQAWTTIQVMFVLLSLQHAASLLRSCPL
jgi:hypothetical protein